MVHLITGGAGFIGTNYINFLIKNYPDDIIVCADKLTYAGKYSNIEPFLLNRHFVFEKIDICNRDAVYNIFEKYNFDCVVNFAAESHVDRSINNPDVFLQSNILGTEVLLSAVNRYHIKRFHQISTDEVYGDLPLDAPDIKFSENDFLKPSSPYSASKASADLLCLAYFRTYGTPITISRCSNNYGPYQFPEKLIPFMIKKALNNEKLPLYGDGKNVRDWIYVEDHCLAVDSIVRNGKIGEIYNIGADNEKANIDIVKFILKYLKKSDSLISFVPDRLGHDRRYAIDSKKIENELGWKALVNFDSGLKKTIDWYLSDTNRLSDCLLQY